MKTAPITVLLVILILSALPTVAGEQKSTSDTYTISLGESMSLHITVTPFEPKIHKITSALFLSPKPSIPCRGREKLGFEILLKSLYKRGIKKLSGGFHEERKV